MIAGIGNHHYHSAYKIFFLTFYTNIRKIVKKKGGVTLEEYVLDIYNFLYTTDWEDIMSIVSILLCIQFLFLYGNMNSANFSLTSPSDVQGEISLSKTNLKHVYFPIIIMLFIRYITAVVKKKEGDDHYHPICHLNFK